MKRPVISPKARNSLFTIARVIVGQSENIDSGCATNTVDTRTEILIQKAMDNLMKNRTSFVIAQPVSTVRDSDLILVMKDGDIVEQGNHEQLLARNGFYAGTVQEPIC